MEALRQAVDRFRIEAEKSKARLQDADARNQVLTATLEGKGEELNTLRTRLDLMRGLAVLTKKLDATRRALQQHSEKIATTDVKADQTSERLERVERERDDFEAQYLKLTALRNEADNAITRAEEAESKNKKLEQLILERDQEITSLSHKLALAEGELEKAEASVADSKQFREEGEQSKQTNEALLRKVQLLEEELDAAEKNVKETVDKLRQVDVKAEHFERQVQRAEQERDQWEKKYEDAVAKYNKAQQELQELEASMQDL
ncbi:hypothetical protein DXG03_002463 [Asterophora parasitica]|uniref:Tropomyosin n=1 Tax=Asterophora parasitica TaxID=117018 RepID=A0A9P7G8E0_9AGAR|nr:hypothetical protein DXG03_002463 [Asterophora parasitica]